MKKTERPAVEVWADWALLGGAKRVGYVHATPARGKQLLAFEYDDAWLAAHGDTYLDPQLQPTRGEQFAAAGRETFAMFQDSSPDRWGRVLMQRREAQLARETKRLPRTLLELDYLLGVFDGHRMGGLRFRFDRGPYLDDNADLASPPWTSLRELEQASLHLEDADAERSPKYGAWLRLLIAPGRSLGGARPKASVLAPDGALWLAKFPSRDDDRNVGGWEQVVHSLAVRAGVQTSEARALKLASRHHTFLTRRFDRTPDGGRIHFASAMTLLDRLDGDAANASYLDIAAALTRNGSHPARDLEQLWRRIVFFVCVSNIDDHLRNHGFLLDAKGWSLAPAYDINPSVEGEGLSLNISEIDNAQDLDLVREVANRFRVATKRADEIIGEVRKAVRGWRDEARALKLPRAEQDRLARAFRV